MKYPTIKNIHYKGIKFAIHTTNVGGKPKKVLYSIIDHSKGHKPFTMDVGVAKSQTQAITNAKKEIRFIYGKR
jgi:hypothetical protein